MADTRRITSEELAAMPQEQAGALMRKAVKIEGTVVVRKADGTIKYDDPALAGTYEEAKDGTDTGNGTEERSG